MTSYGSTRRKKKRVNYALAGSRTRIYCLEGNNANRYTTNAYLLGAAQIMVLILLEAQMWRLWMGQCYRNERMLLCKQVTETLAFGNWSWDRYIGSHL